ncbi:hypothetical protein, partial [Flavobacterium sp. RSSB_23]|uniref:hypothetical protein n=1 Tax=Flavobacterium sp. RSSB_23 TaxID=3447668 RepID=UPI003F3FBC08
QVLVDAPVIDTVDDSVITFSGVLGEANILDAFANDTLNGVLINKSEIITRVITPATPIGGMAVPFLNIATGKVSILPGTPIGVYFIKYQNCERLNPTNCDEGIIKVVVRILLGATAITAVNDNAANVNGYIGEQKVINVLTNDKLSTIQADLTNVN